jgi:hypothetical protein
MAQCDIETYYEDGAWKNKREGSDRAFGADYGTKDEALAAGRDAAKSDSVRRQEQLRPRSKERPGLIRGSCPGAVVPGDGNGRLLGRPFLFLLGKGNLRDPA